MEQNTRMVSMNGKNWSIWKPRMEDLLYCKDLHAPLTGRPASVKDDEEWKKMDRKAVGFIRQWLDDSVFHHVSTETSAQALWKKLEALYERKTAGNKAFLIRKLVNLKYREGSQMTEHLNLAQSIINQLESMKITLEDELQALMVLSSLPESWETLVVSLSNSAPDGVVTMEMVSGCLLNEELRRKDSGSSTPGVFLMEGRGRSVKKDVRHRDSSRSKSRGKSKKDIECYYCKKKGHFKKDCFQMKRDLKGKTKEVGESSGDATTSIVEADPLCLQCSGSSCQDCVDTDWIVDGGASYHCTPHRDYFYTYSAGDHGVIRMANSGESLIVGSGDVHLETELGKIVLKGVRHIPDLRMNLISVGRLDDGGFTSIEGGGTWRLMKGSLVVAKGRKCCGLYRTKAKICGPSVNAAEGDSMELWHRRLGHISEKNLKILVKNKVLPELSGGLPDTCAHCLAGKQKRVSFADSEPKRKAELLYLIHTDVCGPIEPKSVGGAAYFVTFIDDHSRKVWAYSVKQKSDVLAKFEEFRAKVEKMTGKEIKRVRSDNGGEYIGAFDAYCRRHGIVHERTIPRTPQQNGLAERMNRTIIEKIKCMISQAGIGKQFWAEAVQTAVHLINLSPSAPLNGDIPERVWSGKEVSYGHVRVFGCKVHVHVPKEERSKLDEKSRECILMGFPHEEFGYRLWDPVNKKMIRSRDVIFVEDQVVCEPNAAESQVPQFPPTEERLYADDGPVETVVDNGHAEEEVGEPIPDEEMIPDAGGALPVDVPPVVEVPLVRSERVRRPNTRYSPHEYILLTDSGEPESYVEAQSAEDREAWTAAMEEELYSLQKNETYDLVPLPKGKRALKNKWVFKLKLDENRSQPRYKARLVVKGFSQKQGIDFDEIFSPVVKMSSIRLVLGMAASMDLEVEQMDVKTAFLHGDLEEELYMEQPEGFVAKGKHHLVCRLKKSLYGLKQAPRQWYRKFDSFMMKSKFQRTRADHCVYVKRTEKTFTILLLYVDDMLIVGDDKASIAELKKELSESFEMKDLGPARKILGMKITRDRSAGQLWLSQSEYVEKVLKRFMMDKVKPVATPLAGHFRLSSSQSPSSEKEVEEMSQIPYASAVGSLMYAMVCTRPDIAHAVGSVSRYLANPGKDHWSAVKWIFRYLRGTSDLCLQFGGGPPKLIGYSDSDMSGDVDTRRSTSGFVVTFGGGAVS
ncbi:hypothetical protein KSP39_PZI019972 [Platanthera zijinensis]|uniref:Uncharacterized protein n=1 Tax=Platanthera zijinensis TaxID=2320716 RepID=A0AAP0B068_9ASPA